MPLHRISTIPPGGKLLFASLLLLATSLFWSPSTALCDSTTLFRLSYWVPPERKVEFAEIYATRIAPILQTRGWVESSQPGRTTVDSVFSKLFEAPSPTAAQQHITVLWTDATLTTLHRKLDTTCAV